MARSGARIAFTIGMRDPRTRLVSWKRTAPLAGLSRVAHRPTRLQGRRLLAGTMLSVSVVRGAELTLVDVLPPLRQQQT
jgi:hypothetical protein